MQDIRLAVRRLFAKPAFAAVAIGTLTLGIGANAAIFSIVRAVLLQPLPYESPDQLVQIRGRYRETGEVGNLSPADFMDFERDTKTFERMGANGFVGSVTISSGTGEA